MSYQLPPKVIDANNRPMRYHAMDPLTTEERTAADARAVEDFLFAGVEFGSNVFIKYEAGEFVYIVGEFWDTPHRYAGTVSGNTITGEGE